MHDPRHSNRERCLRQGRNRRDRYWGAQTERARVIFDVGEERFPDSLIRCFGLQKIAAARANDRLGVLEHGLAEVVDRAATELRRAGSTPISR